MLLVFWGRLLLRGWVEWGIWGEWFMLSAYCCKSFFFFFCLFLFFPLFDFRSLYLCVIGSTPLWLLYSMSGSGVILMYKYLVS